MSNLVVLTEEKLSEIVENACRKVLEQYLPSQPTPPIIQETYYTTKLASTYLGINEESVRKARRLGKLKAFRLNDREFGFTQVELDNYMRLHSKKRV